MAALAVLFPGSKIAVVSATAAQATLVLRKLREFAQNYPLFRNELELVGREYVVVSREKGTAWFKNGSKIESFSITTVVGERAKILVIDEAPRMNATQVQKNALPILNETRDRCIQRGFEDYTSKAIYITSACPKGNWFFDSFMKTFKEMRAGDKRKFACALNYESAVRVGISKQEYFDEQRKAMPESVFMTEYMSRFLGEEANSIFPFDLTEKCRTLKRVEYMMPKGSKSWYVMSVDLATSKARGADNAVITVLKCTDHADGSIGKSLVFMQSFHGKALDELSEEVRKIYVRFPNIVKIIFDHRGLGDSFPRFFTEPWVDPASGKEYPAWVCDDETMIPSGAIAMLHGFKASATTNQQLVSCLRVAFEQKTIQIPIGSRHVGGDEADDVHVVAMEEKAIYYEADALQVELGNIVMKVSGAGSVLYDVAKTTQHKDRYSSLAMGVWYVYQLEDENKRRLQRTQSSDCIGIVSYM